MSEKPFDMFVLSEEVVHEIRRHPTKPHRHDYEELLIITRGNPVHFIDFFKETLAAPVVIYVAQGKVHEFMPDESTRGWCIRYQNNFIQKSNFHFYSNYLDRINFSFDAGNCRQKIGILCELMLHESELNQDNLEVNRHLLAALLAKLEAEGSHLLPSGRESRTPKQIAFRNFLLILDDNYTRPLGVGFYADKLNTSVRNLNLVCRKVFGKSVSEIIETRKLIEARRLLLNSPMNISEIGYSLGYSEKSYFTRVFSKKTGLTPSDFRTAMQQSNS
jgi:AraC family transcriptional regulator, transcriptional activator of pobA